MAKEPKAKRPPGRPEHQPTDAHRAMVRTMAAFLIPQKEICQAFDPPIHNETLSKHYRAELDTGVARYKLQIARAVSVHLMGRAAEFDASGNQVREEIKPDRAMAMFQAKVVLGQRETVHHNHFLSPELLRSLSDDELAVVERIMARATAVAGEPDERPGGDRSTQH
jgi:hypothetical protein